MPIEIPSYVSGIITGIDPRTEEEKRKDCEEEHKKFKKLMPSINKEYSSRMTKVLNIISKNP